MEKLGLTTSLLGFGCMRLPQKDGHIDYDESTRMIEEAYNGGVRYFDTAYVYNGGESERALGRAIKKFDRSTFFIADKLPVFNVKSREQAEQMFNEHLERLGTDYIDFYLLHALNKGTWENNVKRLGLIEFAEEKRRQGKIRHLGFSFHDTPEVFREIIDSHNWDFCQIQLNYVDWTAQRASECYKMTAERNIPLVVMEPVRGGDLANPADEVKKIFLDAEPDRSVASWALRYVASLPNVRVILSGMSTMEQVKDNLATFNNLKPLDDKERAVIDRVNAALAAVPEIGCTGCRYCMPCPAGVDIPDNFRAYNNYQKYRNVRSTKNKFLNIEGAATLCKECGACMKKCPQHLRIPEELKKVEKLRQSL
jgi:predicted aldo/keto reductase-like oxidoreductase